MVRQGGRFIYEPVSIFKGDVSAPMADFNIPFQSRGVDDRFGELVTDASFLFRACRDVLIWAVGESRPLALGRASVVRDINGWKLYFRFLLLGGVGGGAVGGEDVEEVLLIGLANRGGERGER